MRVLFTCQAALPHLYPLVPLAWALRAAGHEVRIASEARMAEPIVHTGLPAVALRSSLARTQSERERIVTAIYTQEPWPSDWALRLDTLSAEQLAYLELIGNSLINAADAVTDELLDLATDWRPDLVVYDAISFAGAVVAERLGVPAVRHLFGTASLPRIELASDREPLPGYVRMFESRGLRVMLDPAVVVDPTPPSMRLMSEVDSWDMRYVPYNGPGLLPDWLARPPAGPRVCVTWGHTSARALGPGAADPYREAIDALAELGAEIVVVTTAEQIELLGALPAGVRTAASVPLNLVLPSCDLLVQQGGDGTTLSALAAGVPSLVISRKPDAELPAGRLAAAGAGLHLRYQELRDHPASAEIIRDALGKLLADVAYRQAAQRLREEILAAPPPADLVPRLVELAGSR